MPYERFQHDELILRDELALDRTRLANERTVLAYARTGLMVVVTGATAVRFLGGEIPAMLFWGWVFIVVGVILGAFGMWRFLVMARELDRLRSEVDRLEKGDETVE